MPTEQTRSPAHLWRASPLWVKFLLVHVPLLVAYFTVFPPAVCAVVGTLTGIECVTIFVIRVRRCKPGNGRTWAIMGVASSCFIIGNLIKIGYVAATGHDIGLPSISDAFYLMSYPLGFIALWRPRPRSSGQRANRLDEAVFTLAGLVLLWHYLISVYAADSGLHWAARATLIAYPVADLLWLVLLVRMTLGGTTSTSARLVAGGFASLMISDVLYAFLPMHGVTYMPGHVADLGWLFGNLLCAAAAMHPSMGQIKQLASDRESLPSSARLAALAFAIIVSPVLWFVDALRGHAPDPVTAGAAVLIGALVVARLSSTVRVLHTQSTELEASLAEQHALQERLRYASEHDSLTGLPNRATYRRATTAAADLGPVAAGFCDLDGFKQVNDTFGHQAGDELLQIVTARFRRVLRDGDVVARLGGDEFAVLWPGVSDPVQAAALGQRLVDALADPVALADGRVATVGVSVGIALAGTGADYDLTVARADEAVYRAKRTGRNRVVLAGGDADAALATGSI